MRLKKDFVTNSSSISFIVLIPDGFDIRKHLSVKEQAGFIETLFKDKDDYNDYLEWFDGDQENALKKFISLFQCDGMTWGWHEQDDDFPYGALRGIYDLCNELGLVIYEKETDQDGSGTVSFFKHEYIQYTLDNYKGLVGKT